MIKRLVRVPQKKVKTPSQTKARPSSRRVVKRASAKINSGTALAEDIFLMYDAREAEHASPRPRRGEVWQVELGLAAKSRPALILGVPTDTRADVYLHPAHNLAD